MEICFGFRYTLGTCCISKDVCHTLILHTVHMHSTRPLLGSDSVSALLALIVGDTFLVKHNLDFYFMVYGERLNTTNNQLTLPMLRLPSSKP